jgi:hypothetical protein
LLGLPINQYIYKNGRKYMVLDNCTYNKIKLIHELSALAWFIDKHALTDAQKAGDKECADALQALYRDLTKHLEKIQTSMCIISQ